MKIHDKTAQKTKKSGKWIYAIFDSGYSNGVKVGRATETARFLKTPSGHSPRLMKCLGAWFIEKDKWDFLRRELGGPTTTDDDVERWFRDHENVFPLIFEHSDNGITYTNGSEYLDINPDHLLDLIDGKLARTFGEAPSLQYTQDISGDYDFMRSGSNATPIFVGRQVLWLWKEWETGRIKIQRNSEWSGPRQKTWTYSRIGVCPIAAFTYPSPDCSDDEHDINVEKCWQAAVSQFCDTDSRKILGWLKNDVSNWQLEQIIRDHGLDAIDRFWDQNARPQDVRIGYRGVKKRKLKLPLDVESFL